MLTVPLSVPNAIVLTGTPACLAAAEASSLERPELVLPSDSSTTAAGGGLPPLPPLTSLMASSDV
jgi:hypothetical protein